MKLMQGRLIEGSEGRGIGRYHVASEAQKFSQAFGGGPGFAEIENFKG
jgi:hypothetical protein